MPHGCCRAEKDEVVFTKDQFHIACIWFSMERYQHISMRILAMLIMWKRRGTREERERLKIENEINVKRLRVVGIQSGDEEEDHQTRRRVPTQPQRCLTKVWSLCL